MGKARIIAGSERGRKIDIPEHGTRPTSDRAREGLFSSLQARFGLSDQVVLDLFAGSGALGLEALSRGVESAVFVENNAQAADVISANIKTLGYKNATVVKNKASDYLAHAPLEHFTMVLADPPYDLEPVAVDEMVEALIPHLANQAVVVVERAASSPEVTWPEGFESTGQKLKKRTFGIARMDMAVWNNDSIS